MTRPVLSFVRAGAGLAAVALLTTGCSFKGLNSLVLPGAKGNGSSGYELTVELPTAANLVPNSEVKVNDVTVGTVRSIRLDDDWHAIARVSVENSIDLPSDTTARVAQKSLLGAEYLELKAPRSADARPAAENARLKDGDTIPLARSGNYPETEEVLSALSTFLNGTGIENLNTIVRELADTLGTSTVQSRQLIDDLRSLTSTVSGQRDQIIDLIEAGDRLGTRLNGQTSRISTALDDLSRGIATVSAETPTLIRALHALDTLSAIGRQVIHRDGANLTADVHALARVLKEVDAAGQGLPDSLDLIGTVLFPVSRVAYVVKGDYLNFAATVDLSLPALQKGLLPGATNAQIVDLLMTILGLKAPSPGVPPPSGATTPPPGAVPTTPPENPVGDLLEGLLGTPSKVPEQGSSGLGGLLGTLLGGGG